MLARFECNFSAVSPPQLKSLTKATPPSKICTSAVLKHHYLSSRYIVVFYCSSYSFAILYCSQGGKSQNLSNITIEDIDMDDI